MGNAVFILGNGIAHRGRQNQHRKNVPVEVLRWRTKKCRKLDNMMKAVQLYEGKQRSESCSVFHSYWQFIAIMLSAGRAWDWFLIQHKQQQQTQQPNNRQENNWRGSEPIGGGLDHDVIMSTSVFQSPEVTSRCDVTDSEVVTGAGVQGMGGASQ